MLWKRKSKRKPTKLAVTWDSNISKRYKRNTNHADLFGQKDLIVAFIIESIS